MFSIFMMNKFISALITGIVFGILIGVTTATPCLIIISFVLMVALGAFTVYLAKGDIKNTMDAVVSSGIAGAISGIVGAVVSTAGIAILVTVVKMYNSETFTSHEMGGIGIYGLICAPVLIVTGIILAAIGGYVYYEMIAKKNAQ